MLLQLLNQHLRVAPALIVFFAPRGRQVVRRTFGKTAFGLKVCERLGRERDEFVQADVARLVFDELDQLAADALVFVRRVDIQAGQLAFALFRIKMQRDAGDRVAVDLENVVVAKALLDDGARAFDQFVRLDGFLGQLLDRAHVLFLRAARIC